MHVAAAVDDRPAIPVQYSKELAKWRSVVRPELQVLNFGLAVRHALAVPSACVPDGGVMLSLTNKHHLGLRALQFAFVKQHMCMFDRLVTTGYNASDSFGRSVVVGEVVPASDFRRSNYANMVWAKWRLISDALRFARLALWIDADVLLLRNPWEALRLLGPAPAGGTAAAAAAATFDIRYQSEYRCWEVEPARLRALCPRLNGGQLLVSNRQLARDIYAMRPKNLTNLHLLDQDYADAYILNRSNYSHAPLPGTFHAHCWHVRTFDLCKQVTHHFNCAGTGNKKGVLMKLMAQEWTTRGCANQTRVVV